MNPNYETFEELCYICYCDPYIYLSLTFHQIESKTKISQLLKVVFNRTYCLSKNLQVFFDLPFFYELQN